MSRLGWGGLKQIELCWLEPTKHTANRPLKTNKIGENNKQKLQKNKLETTKN